MRPKKSLTISCFSVAFFAAFTILGLSFGTVAGYFLAAMFSQSVATRRRLHRKLWLYIWGRPLSEEKKKKIEQYRGQMRDYHATTSTICGTVLLMPQSVSTSLKK